MELIVDSEIERFSHENAELRAELTQALAELRVVNKRCDELSSKVKADYRAILNQELDAVNLTSSLNVTRENPRTVVAFPSLQGSSDLSPTEKPFQTIPDTLSLQGIRFLRR